jgi:uncharacterized damage-inducible protein DinB
MESVAHFRELFQYDRWGNQSALASLNSVAGSIEKPLKVFSHVIGAQRVWRARFVNSSPPDVKPWPALTLEECQAALDEVYASWVELLGGLTEERLGQDLVYRTTQGVEFKTPIRDVLIHLLMHSTYHRGQVAAAVRESGGKPALTDYVVYVRQRG